MVKKESVKNIPAVPYKLDLFEPRNRAAARLAHRGHHPANSASFTINGQTATGFEFLFGQDPPSNQLADAIDAVRDALIRDPEGLIRSIYDARIAGVAGPAMPAYPAHLTAFSLDDPRKFSMSWTTFDNVARDAAPFLRLGSRHSKTRPPRRLSSGLPSPTSSLRITS